MGRLTKMAALSLVVICATTVWAQVPPHIQAVHEFLIGWGKEDWDAMKAQAGSKVTVKVGGTQSTLDIDAKKADVRLFLPFRGLSSVRENGKITGVTVDQITVQAGGQEKKGKATVTLQEKDGKFTVTGVAME